MRGDEPGVRRPRTLAVASGKGGVGKTFLSVNLSVALARAGHRVGLFDGDIGLANANLLLGLEPDGTIADVLGGARSIDEIVARGPGDLAVISGGHGVAELRDLTPGACEEILDLLKPLHQLFDLMIIDTGPGLGSDVQAFLEASDLVAIVLCSEPAAFMDAYALLKLLRTETGRREFLVITNMVEGESAGATLFRHFDAVASRFLDLNLAHAGSVLADPHVRSAALRRQCLFDLYPNAAAANGIARLAGVVRERLGLEARLPARTDAAA